MKRLLSIIAAGIFLIALSAFGPFHPGGGAGNVVIAADTPGISVALFNNPPYNCTTNYYISPTGSDGNNGTSSGTPKFTLSGIQSAITNGTGAVCVNVATGTYTYTSAQTITKGGSGPNANGFIAYRCAAAPNPAPQCAFTTNSTISDFIVMNASAVGYVWFDGIEVNGNGTPAPKVTNDCIGDYTANQGPVHHVYVTNSYIHNCGASGLSVGNTEFQVWIHDEISANSLSDNTSSEGSGADLVVLAAVGGYTPSGFDTNTPSQFNLGNPGSVPYANIVAWNYIHDNITLASGGTHTDGNNFIADSFDLGTCYAHYTLVAKNVSARGGGKGFHNFGSSGVTYINNTAYGNGQDGAEAAFAAGDLNESGGGHCSQSVPASQWVNNIGYSPQNYTTPSPGNNNYGLVCGNGSETALGTSYSHNSATGLGAGNSALFNNCSSVPYFSCSTNGNSCGSNPSFTSAGASNWALQAGSPSISAGSTSTLATGYTPPSSWTDLGACDHSLTTCPIIE